MVLPTGLLIVLLCAVSALRRLLDNRTLAAVVFIALGLFALWATFTWPTLAQWVDANTEWST